MKQDLKNSTARVATPAIITKAGFSDTLSLADRRLLRAVVRKNHAKLFRDPPTDAQCDQLIDTIGPIAQIKMIARANGEDANQLVNTALRRNGG